VRTGRNAVDPEMAIRVGRAGPIGAFDDDEGFGQRCVVHAVDQKPFDGREAGRRWGRRGSALSMGCRNRERRGERDGKRPAHDSALG